MSAPSWDEIKAQIEQGILEAQRQYKRGTWEPLCYCPEYFITSNIFQHLLKLDIGMSLENSPEELLNAYQQGSISPHRSVPRGEGRADIFIWRGNPDSPRAIVEVKRCALDWKNQSPVSDSSRISGLLEKYEGLEFGVLAGCIHEAMNSRNTNKAKVGEKIEATFEDIHKAIKKSVSNRQLVTPLCSTIRPLLLKKYDPKDEWLDDWYWTPVIFKISRRKLR